MCRAAGVRCASTSMAESGTVTAATGSPSGSRGVGARSSTRRHTKKALSSERPSWKRVRSPCENGDGEGALWRWATHGVPAQMQAARRNALPNCLTPSGHAFSFSSLRLFASIMCLRRAFKAGLPCFAGDCTRGNQKLRRNQTNATAQAPFFLPVESERAGRKADREAIHH